MHNDDSPLSDEDVVNEIDTFLIEDEDLWVKIFDNCIMWDQFNIRVLYWINLRMCFFISV